MEEQSINYMPLSEFIDLGLLQEVNRLFFHPLGLALEVSLPPNGEETDPVKFVCGIWDYRNDNEGIIYGISEMSNREFKRKAISVAGMVKNERISILGYLIQPLESDDENEKT